MNQIFNRIRQKWGILVLLGAIAGFSSCDKASYDPAAVNPDKTWLFQTDIQPIFNAKCIECHKGGSISPDLRDGKSFTALSTVYLTAPAETSRLYLQMKKSDHIPYSTAASKLKVLYWITQGALNN
jgi:hypothetical protein